MVAYRDGVQVPGATVFLYTVMTPNTQVSAVPRYGLLATPVRRKTSISPRLNMDKLLATQAEIESYFGNGRGRGNSATHSMITKLLCRT